VVSGGAAGCADGGVTVEEEGSGSGQEVCNGQTGFTDTLPTGKTEKGDWSVLYEAAAAQAPGSAAISFNIPLAATPAISFIGPEEGEGESKEKLPAGCKGNFEHPEAVSGNLCVFSNATMANATGWKANGLTKIIVAPVGVGTGAQLYLASEAAGTVLADGTWAVTG
jgi:hypothetical protein